MRVARGRTSGTRRASQRDEPSILRPDPIRWERQCESHVGSVLWISPFEEAAGLSKFVHVVRLSMLGNVSPKDSQGFLKGVRGLAAPPREFVAMDFYLVEQILRHMQIVPAQDEEASGRGVLRVPTYLSVRTESMCRQVLLSPADLEAHRVRQAFQGRSIGPPMPEEAQGRRRRNR